MLTKYGLWELRECPFCGKPDVAVRCKPGEDGFRARYYVLCDYNDGGCGASGGWYHSPDEAVESWNVRRRKYHEGT